MNRSIRAKKVSIVEETVTQEVVFRSYCCPSCKTTFKGDIGVTKETIRFRCRCGQELICQ